MNAFPDHLHEIAPRLALARDQYLDSRLAERELLRVWDSDEPEDWQPGVLTSAIEWVRRTR